MAVNDRELTAESLDLVDPEDGASHSYELDVQSYEKKPVIAGVVINKMPRFKDDGGSFFELARINDGQVADMPEFDIRQINYSCVEPGTIKAWHLHFKQEDLWFVPPCDRLLVGLYDARKSSPTHGTSMRLVLGDGDAQLLRIPRGVAHGCANVYNRPMQLIYLVNQQFNLDDPDERRLDYTAFVGSAFWTIQKG